MDKKKLESKLKVLESTYQISLANFLNSNKRLDRDRCIELRDKVNIVKELIKEYK
jgi:hypothetical protein